MNDKYTMTGLVGLTRTHRMHALSVPTIFPGSAIPGAGHWG